MDPLQSPVTLKIERKKGRTRRPFCSSVSGFWEGVRRAMAMLEPQRSGIATVNCGIQLLNHRLNFSPRLLLVQATDSQRLNGFKDIAAFAVVPCPNQGR